LYLADEEVRLSPPQLRDWLIAQDITVSFVPTPLAEELLALSWPTQISLRYLLTGGDRLHRAPSADLPFQLVNHYGPTECTVLATAAVIAAETEPPTGLPTIGRAIANTRLYVLDRSAQPVPIGIPGELYIGGASVAAGYLHQPELTAAKFIPNPFSTDPADRLYKTGDIVRYLPDGTLDFIGRGDDQVKIRGFRIELGEIESALLKHPLVREAATTVQNRPQGDPFIAAFLVTEHGQPIADASLRAFLQQMLPDYMLPAVYTRVETLPLTANGGKIDRRSLPAVAFLPASALPETPHNALEETIITIWRELLGRENVGRQDNFFELGGHSLLLVRLQEQIRLRLQKNLPLLDFFTYPTVSLLARRLSEDPHGQPPAPSAAPGPLTAPAASPVPQQRTTGIAVIGMAGRFPGADTIEAFWQNLSAGVESISRFSTEELAAAGADLSYIDDPHFVPAKGILEDADCFDAPFFGITPRDAETLDPQQRVFLECAFTTLEHAGYDAERYPGQIGIYAGSSMNTYFLNNLYPNKTYLKMVGMYQMSISNEKDSLTTRTAYKLNLKGPAVTVQTACSTSLVAVHMACQALLNGECDMALAGGVSIQAPLKEGYLYQDGDILSPDGHCRAFDTDAQGTVSGNGVGLVLLKPLEQALHDGDTIHAVIKGTAINNDGAVKIGYTAPSPEGQAGVIIKALDAAQVSADTISYVETHGTGTKLGDPIEIEGLTRAFRARGAQESMVCAIGSAKSNIGHLDAAAGIAGTLKTILALKQRQIPPSLHVVKPNAALDFARSPFFVNTHLSEWSATPAHPRRAGVSSFGIGGTNAHIILEEAPSQAPSGRSARTWQLLTLSALNASALEKKTDQLLSHLKQQPDLNLADVAYTLQSGRKELPYRKIVLLQDGEEHTPPLEKQDQQYTATHHVAATYALVFVFPGQGSQYVQMARDLYTGEALFRSQVDHCAALLAPELGLDLRSMLFPDDAQVATAAAQLNETWLTQPALFVIEYALAQLWISWGIQPQAMIGHSIGEY
ncbi:MAG TPA: beta-ketoacyl synthase N-terminal-like domain-containing protein, partial [Ktedonobacteraceae bacterium]|nr:beta-ketoacyl synthase N-terminal-like domain-containing protein [Ktedonobacteraceae bacterium]